MAENLLIRLGSHAGDTIHWLVWSSHEKNIIASGELSGAEELTQLTDKSLTRDVTILVPSCDVTLKSLNVPAKSQKAIRQAAPYMLEDELAQDVEQLFFAYGKNNNSETEENCFVVVIERQQMHLWLSWLSSANITSGKMLPDVLAMPEVDNHWNAIAIGQQILIRQEVWQGTLVDSNLWEIAEKKWQTQENIIIDAFSSLPISSSQITVNAQPEELPLALFAQNIANQRFNLLQGEFQIKTERSPLIKTWAWAAGIAVFALLLNIGVKSFNLWEITRQQANIEQQIIEQYKKTFPETKRVRVSTIRSQLKRKLTEIGSGSSDANFLAMLTKTQPAFLQVPQLKPESIKFDGKRNELRMQAIANDYQQFETFKNALEEQALSVSQGTQNSQGDKISGSFSITAKKGG